jgi:hypothetical protein
MIRKWTIGTMLGAAVLVALVAAIAQTRVAKEWHVEPSAAGIQLTAAASDLAGEWRLDPAKSEMPTRGGRFGDGSRRGGGTKGDGRDGWSGRDGMRHRDGARGDKDGRGPGFRGRGRLPAFLTVTQSTGRVQLADSTGAVVQEIVIGSKLSRPNSGEGRSENGPRVRQASGQWRNGILEVERTTPRGTMTQTFALEDGGRTLVIRSARTGGERDGGDRAGRGARGAMTLVYRKVSST